MALVVVVVMRGSVAVIRAAGSVVLARRVMPLLTLPMLVGHGFRSWVMMFHVRSFTLQTKTIAESYRQDPIRCGGRTGPCRP